MYKKTHHYKIQLCILTSVQNIKYVHIINITTYLHCLTINYRIIVI